MAFSGYNVMQDETATQAKKDAQVSNQASPIVAQQPTQQTEQNKQLTTTDSSNGGITPTSSNNQFNVTPGTMNVEQTNKDLEQVGGTNTIESLYGFSNVGYDSSEKINELPEYKQGEDGGLYKKIVTSYKANTSSPSFTSFSNDMNMIDTNTKTKNSGTGLDINFGIDLQSTLKIADAFYSNNDLLNNKDLKNKGYIQNFLNAYNALSNIPEDTASRQQLIGALKYAMIPLLDKTISVGYASQGMNTADLDYLKEQQKGLQKFLQFYGMEGKDIKTQSDQVLKNLNKVSVSYKNIKDTKSINAKNTLMKNSVYTSFLDDVYKNNPSLRTAIDKFRTSSTISSDESTFIEEAFLGPNGYKNINDARNEAIKSLGPIEGSALFSGFNEIFEVKKLTYKTGYDDYLENVQTSNNYSSVGQGIDYSYDDGNILNSNFTYGQY